MIVNNPEIPYKPFYGYEDFYRFYLAYCSENKLDKLRDYDIKKILPEMHEDLFRHLRKGDIFKMPGKLGKLTIKRKEINYKNPPIDKTKSTKKKKIYNLFDKTDGWYPKIVWGALEFMKNKTLYIFQPSKYMIKMTELEFKDHYRNYIPCGIFDIDRLKIQYAKRKEHLIKHREKCLDH